MNNCIQLAKRLFDWNRANLVSNANLQKADLCNFFASNFTVIVNGRRYDGNYDNYFEFLNQFRSSIKKISYSIHNGIVENRNIALPLKAEITRTHGDKEIYEAILILQFDEDDKIILWHEVYVKTS